MNDSAWDGYVAIGRRLVPRTVADVPASGVFWSGPVKFVIREEMTGAFRWVKISDDGRNLQLAQSASVFVSQNECGQQVMRLDPKAQILFEHTVDSAPWKSSSVPPAFAGIDA